MRKSIHSQKGFTLIELLVVISIVSLLASTVLAATTTGRVKARDAQRISQLKEIQNSLEIYYSEHGAYPRGLGFSPWDRWGPPYPSVNWENPSGTRPTPMRDLVTGGYISSIPEDPVNIEGGGAGYLGGGPTNDLGYLYCSNDAWGHCPSVAAAGDQAYVLGTNLESGGGADHGAGNYQLSNIQGTMITLPVEMN